MRVEIVAAGVAQALRRRIEETRDEALPQQTALAVAAVGGEAVADDLLAVAHDVGEHGDDTDGHLGEIDIGVGDGGSDGSRAFPDIDDAHGGRASGA